ncbi:MAG: hypothetical protein J1F10_03635 [Muribaculaceae bacterium]|nr:hypothetical protein [Muribaculaceae bacterium]
MKNISNLDDLLSLNNQIIKSRKNYFTGIGLTLLGTAIITIGTLINPEHDSIMLATMTAGVVIALIGLVKLCMPSNRLIYAGTGEQLKKIDIYYDSEYDGAMIENIHDCTFDKLKKLAHSRGSKKLATVYSTPSGKIRIAQIFNFVPYEYEPKTEPMVIIA